MKKIILALALLGATATASAEEFKAMSKAGVAQAVTAHPKSFSEIRL